MTVYIPFQPAATASPPFTAVIVMDGVQYNLTASWNIYAPRWYITIADANGNVIVNQPLIESPINADIYLAPGIFQTSTLVYRGDTGNFEQTP